MVRFEPLKDNGVLCVEPKGTLSVDDFREMARVIDPYFRENGKPVARNPHPPRLRHGGRN